MHTAAKEGNEYTMDGLVKLGADINIKDKDGVSETLIITAVGLTKALKEHALFVHEYRPTKRGVWNRVYFSRAPRLLGGPMRCIFFFIVYGLHLHAFLALSGLNE